MVDVVQDLIFPTVLARFLCNEDDLSRLDRSQMITYIRNNERTIQDRAVHQSSEDLYKLSTFRNLYDVLMEQCINHIKKLDYSFDSIEMTGMWGNNMLPGTTHPPHTHSNNFLSGVFYLLSPNGKGKNGKPVASPIQFFDPRVQSNIFSPRKKPNPLNSNVMSYPCLEGVGYIFPSWLQHWVPPTPVERISISWNIIVRGQYGIPGDLQNARI